MTVFAPCSVATSAHAHQLRDEHPSALDMTTGAGPAIFPTSSSRCIMRLMRAASGLEDFFGGMRAGPRRERRPRAEE